MYKLKEALDSNQNLFYVLCLEDIPDFYLSLYLKQKSINSFKTSKTYGEKLAFFLNHFHKKNLHYSELNLISFKNFFLYLLNFNLNDDFSNIPRIGYSTLTVYKSAIIDFYRFFSTYKNQNFFNLNKKTNLSDNKTIPWKEIQETIKITIDIHLKNFKVNNKKYIKEYKPEEIKAIYTQLKSLRNKSIFLLTLHGMRIDEVLSITQENYNGYTQIVTPSRSKGKQNSRKRQIIINDECVKVLENYILNERTIALKKVEEDTPYLFVNLRINNFDKKLKPLSYINFYKSFLTSVKKANIFGNARTHAGRSHRAIELLRFVNDENTLFTDEHFRILMGWKNIESSKPYVEHENEKKAIEISREIEKMRKRISND